MLGGRRRTESRQHGRGCGAVLGELGEAVAEVAAGALGDVVAVDLGFPGQRCFAEQAGADGGRFRLSRSSAGNGGRSLINSASPIVRCRRTLSVTDAIPLSD
jgi:hypothetical protein